jgi:hypothetical protein
VTKRGNSHRHTLCLLWLALFSTGALHASILVTLSASPASPQPVGTIITWTATVQDSEQGTHEYRFLLGPQNGTLATVWDYGQSNIFHWAFSQTEGTYQVKVAVKNTSNQTTAHAVQSFVVTFSGKMASM